jgi:hypothetical protein
MKIGFGDTETLSSLSCASNGEKQLVDSYGLITVESESHLAALQFLLSLSTEIAASVGKPVYSTYNVGTLSPLNVELFQEYTEIMTQQASGREFSVDTYNFHLRNGYDPATSTRKSLSSITKVLEKLLVNVQPLYFRGTDFDVPIWASTFKQCKSRFVKYNHPRDVRTAIDIMTNAEECIGFMDYAKFDYPVSGKSSYVRKAQALMTDVRKVLDELNHLRHSALVDAYFDAVNYYMLKYITFDLQLIISATRKGD